MRPIQKLLTCAADERR